MAKAMTPAETRAAMTKWKVPVKYYPGWETRGRRAFGDVHGCFIHHTGSDSQSDDYLKWLFTIGRESEGIPAPLCNVSTDMDGDLHIGATLVANHAGAGSSQTMRHVVNEDYAGYAQELHPGADDLSGNFSNGSYYGNEVRFDGGQPMTAKQWTAATLWAAAVCDHHGWSALSVIGHREHTRRKNDPGSTPMNKFRADVAALLKAGPPNTGSTTPKGTTMASVLTPTEQAQLAKAGWLADQFAQGAQFEEQLDRIEALLSTGGVVKNQLDRIEADTDRIP